jgi:HEAT repeat protein
LNQQTKKVNRDLAEQRMLHSLLASNVTTNGQIATICFSFGAAELARQSNAPGTPQRPPGQRKPKTPGETFVTVRVTGVPIGTDDALYKRIFSLAGEPKSYSATRLSDTVITRMNTNVTAEELANRIDFGEVKRVKGRGVLVAADPKRVASLPKAGAPQNTASALSKELAPSGSARAVTDPFDFVAKFKSDIASTDSKRRRKAVSDLCAATPNEHRDEIAKDLQSLIADEDSEVAEASLQALRTWGGRSCVSNVILLLRTTRSLTIRAEAMLTLANFPDEQGAQAVADHWDSKTAPIALEAMGPVAEKALASLLKNREPGVPEGACKILKRFQQKQPLAEDTVLALIRYIRDEQFPTRIRDAIELLSTVKEVYVAEAIADQLIKGFGLRDNIVKALINIGPVAEDVVLERCLKNDDPFVRQLACDVLKAVGTKKSIPALQTAARDFVTKKHAEEAIAEITKRSKQKS